MVIVKCPVCGNEDEHYISYINKRPYCRKCIAFGRVYLDEVYPGTLTVVDPHISKGNLK